MSFQATIQVESNLRLALLDGKKVVDERVGHNIFLNLGREWLAQLIAYKAFLPSKDEPYRNDRIKYMGVGIGGTRQLAMGVANALPLKDDYPGQNSKTDTDPTVTKLERPVRISGSFGPSHIATDVWLGRVQAPPVFPSGREVQFRGLFGRAEVSYAPYLTVPLSEVGLFTSAAEPNKSINTMVAYDTFDTLSKTDAFDLEIAWTIRF